MVGGFSFSVELVSYLANMAGCHSLAFVSPSSFANTAGCPAVGRVWSRSGRGPGRGWAGVEVGPGRLVQRLRRVRFGRVWPRLGRGRGWGRGRVGSGRVGSVVSGRVGSNRRFFFRPNPTQPGRVAQAYVWLFVAILAQGDHP